jgi:hypothetical protein
MGWNMLLALAGRRSPVLEAVDHLPYNPEDLSLPKMLHRDNVFLAQRRQMRVVNHNGALLVVHRVQWDCEDQKREREREAGKDLLKWPAQKCSRMFQNVRNIRSKCSRMF